MAKEHQNELFPLLKERLLSAKAELSRKKQRDKERRREKRRRSLKTSTAEQFMNFRKRMLVAKRRRVARKKGIEFTVTAEMLSWPTYCPILGIKLDYLTRGRLKPDLPTIDRVDPKYGYHPWNARIVSFRANTIKSSASLKEIQCVLDYVRRVKDEASELTELRLAP